MRYQHQKPDTQMTKLNDGRDKHSSLQRCPQCSDRASFLSQDRADLEEVAKSLAQQMSRPLTNSMEDPKRLGSYLLGTPSLASRCEQQRMPANISVSVDSDFAADRATRKSTTGMVPRRGRLPIMTLSNLQKSVGLNERECEFHSLVHGAAHGLGLQAYRRDLGTDLPFDRRVRQFKCESVCEPTRLGQAMTCSKHPTCGSGRGCCIKNVPTADNISDILRKAIDRRTHDKHLKTMGFAEVQASR